MERHDVVAIIAEVLESVVKNSEVTGRHEINRTDLAAFVADLKANGLPLVKKVVSVKKEDLF